jgi:hypothetical protein
MRMSPTRLATYSDRGKVALAAGAIGYRAAQYMTAEQIATALDYAVSPVQIEEAFRLFEFTPKVLAPAHELVHVSIAGRHRTKLSSEGMNRGLELPDLCAALLGKVVDDDLFAAVLDE